jgi:hypothetical protein
MSTIAPFAFSTAGRIEFGCGKVSIIGDVVSSLGGTNVLVRAPCLA